MKYTRYEDIPQFITDGEWECNFSMNSLYREIQRLVKEENLDLNPDFQRGHVWTEDQQVAWLEFFLAGGKTGRVIYLNNPSWGRSVSKKAYNDFVIVDGKQRLNAISRYLNNEIKVYGSYANEYTDNPRGILVNLRLNVNSLKTRKEVLKWYLQFNAGGTPHTPEEIERVRQLLEKEK